jgi:hypothetical protein
MKKVYENEVRNLVKTIAHHSLADVVTMIQGRCGKGVDPNFIEQLWKAERGLS